MGTPAMVRRMVEALPESYSMTLNKEDMEKLIRVMGSFTGFYTLTDEEEEWAIRFFSDIATTLDVEGI